MKLYALCAKTKTIIFLIHFLWLYLTVIKTTTQDFMSTARDRIHMCNTCEITLLKHLVKHTFLWLHFKLTLHL